MKKFFLFALLATQALPATDDAAKAAQGLKSREPNWRSEIVETHPQGAPKKVIFYRPLPQGNEAPVKQLVFHENGKIQAEMDLIQVADDAPVAQEWHSNLVPHGTRVDFSPDGKVVNTALYEEGRLNGLCTKYHPNGKPALVQTYCEGKLVGQAEAFFEDGSLKEKAHYEEGLLNGELTQYDAEGRKILAVPFENGQMHGLALEWYPNGATKSKRHYFQGQLHGNGKDPAVTQYDEERHVRELVDFSDGHPVGMLRRYHPNGQEAYRVSFKNGLKEGVEKTFAEDGSLIGEGTFVQGVPRGKHWKKHANLQDAFLAEFDAEGRSLEPIVEWDAEGHKVREYSLAGEALDGSFMEWFPNGSVRIERHYAHGEYEGEQKEFYPGHQIKLQTHYKGGKLDGLYQAWHENGVLAQKAVFRGGLKDASAGEWYENGNAKVDSYYKEDKPDGVQSEWYENGQLKARSEFVAGMKQGLHREWNEAGDLMFEAAYDQDSLHGTLVTFWRHDQVRTRFSFSHGKKEGKQESFHENGNAERSAFFHEGLCEGEMLAWYPDGALLSQQQFLHGKPVQEHREFYPVGEIAQKDEERLSRLFHYDDEGRLHGSQTTFYPDERPQTVASYDHGVLNGLRKAWDPTGRLVEEAYYLAGKMDGLFFQKLSDGREVSFTYKNNLKNGLHEIYGPSSKEPHERVKLLEANFVDEQVDGLVTEYGPTGIKQGETPYRQGMKEGVAKLYDPNGKLMAAVEFHGDQQSGLSAQYFPHGAVFRETPFVEGKKEGEEKTYHDNHAVASVCRYREDLLEGLSQSWSREGVLVFEAEYQQGKKHGFFRKYYDDGAPLIVQSFVRDLPDGEKRKFDKNGQVAVSYYREGELIDLPQRTAH